MDADERLGPEPDEPERADPFVGAPPAADDEEAATAERRPLTAEPAAALSSDPRPRALLVLVAIVVLIGGIGIVYDAVTGNGPDPEAALATAVEHSANARTADVALALSIDAGGTHETITGNGSTNFRTKASNMTMTYTFAGRSILERAIVDGNTGWFNIGPIVGQVAPGKSWLSMDLSSGGPAGPNGAAGSVFSDPNAMVAVLRTSGTTVTMLGTSTVDGTSVRGYAIDLSPDGIKRVMSSSQVPSSIRAQLSHVHYNRLEYAAYIDGADYLKEVRVVGGFGAYGVSATVTSAMHFSDYGVLVHVVPPPADEVIPFNQFQRLQAQSHGHATT